MSGSPQWLLQQAIYIRLSADTDLVTTLGAGVYDDVDEDTAFPYVTIGDVTEAPSDTMGTTGRDVTVTIHVWTRPDPAAASQARGMKQAKQIQSRVDELLDRWQPTVTGWNATDFQQEFFETFRDPDGVTRHGVARYRIHLHQ